MRFPATPSAATGRLRRPLHPPLLVAVLLLLGTLLAGAAAAAEEACGSCHAKLLSAKNVHPPAEDCQSCHEAVATPHPQKGVKTFKLAQEGSDLCSSCHEAFGKQVVHAPAKEGACVTCHDPHGSDEAKLLTAAPKDLCASCHADKLEARHLHGPVSAGECLTCHEAHQADAKGLLRQPAEELCAGCHAETAAFRKAKHVHPALDGGCSTCHDPHGAAYPMLLAEQGAPACYACHEPVATAVEKAAFVHAPVKSEKGCVSCHSPHSSDEPKLLPKREDQTCLACHKNVLPKSAGVLHGPIKDGQCTPCHAPHAGASKKLLADEFPAEPYVAYSDNAFALCFACHDRALVQYPETSFATGFRDGEKNLHHLHVNNPQKGRSCALCHETHGGAGPLLVAASVAFGRWSLPVKFVKTENGGACSPGCHRPYSYDRKNPGHRQALPAAAKKPN